MSRLPSTHCSARHCRPAHLARRICCQSISAAHELRQLGTRSDTELGERIVRVGFHLLRQAPGLLRCCSRQPARHQLNEACAPVEGGPRSASTPRPAEQKASANVSVRLSNAAVARVQ